jgi:hypothetical protein
MHLSPGSPVRCEMSKWGDRPHWQYAGILLGEDAHGQWIGFPAGTTYVRPGHVFVGERDHVGLVPAGGDAWHLAAFYGAQGPSWPALDGAGVAVYVDMTTPAVWEGATLRAVDLDLDVVKGFNGRVIVDDEDEFADHQVRFGYPPEVVEAARASCEQVHAAVAAGLPPYDGSHRRWLDVLATLAPLVE